MFFIARKLQRWNFVGLTQSEILQFGKEFSVMGDSNVDPELKLKNSWSVYSCKFNCPAKTLC